VVTQHVRKRARFGINPWEIVAAIVIIAIIAAIAWPVATRARAAAGHDPAEDIGEASGMYAASMATDSPALGGNGMDEVE